MLTTFWFTVIAVTWLMALVDHFCIRPITRPRFVTYSLKDASEAMESEYRARVREIFNRAEARRVAMHKVMRANTLMK